jgi:hypothetical protein
MGAPKQTPHRTEGTTRILSASVDANLNYTRALLLRHHGFEVTTSESLQDARDQIEAYNFDVLVFGSTLPRDICWQLAGLFRSRNAQGRIIEILPSPWATPKNNPDATVVSSDEPTSLVKTIHQGPCS